MNGNDFTHGWVHNGNVLFDVPNYQNWFGNAPTAAAMLLGYYDGMEQYADLFEGNADQQTPEINEAIASSGTTATGEKAEYTYDPVTGVWTITKRAKTGTGHISDYALYHDPLDPYALNTTWDLSDPEALTNEELLRQFGLTDFDGLHTDDCLADLMQTSQVYAGNDLGETAPGYEVDDEGNPVLDDDGNKIGFVDRGIEDYVDSKGYSAEAVVHDDLSDFTWDDLVSNIDAGKPMLFYIDTNGEYDRSVFYYDTLDNDGNPIPRLEYDQISLFYVELDEFGNRKRDGNGEPIPHDFTQDTRGDTWIVVVGYSEETKEYAYYTTDDADIRWTSFVDVDTDEYYYHYNERAGKIIHVGHVLSDRHRPKDWIGAVDQIITLELT
jgi:hypothetical protein